MPGLLGHDEPFCRLLSNTSHTTVCREPVKWEDSSVKADVVVIGAGIVGASCAHYLAQAGLDVVVVDRGLVASGTTGAGEGNILVSDKERGPEL